MRLVPLAERRQGLTTTDISVYEKYKEENVIPVGHIRTIQMVL